MHRQMGFGAAALACTLAWFAVGCGASGSEEATVTAFETRTLTTNHCQTVIDDYDPTTGVQYAGDDRGGIALTPTGILYNGDSAAVDYDKVSLAEPPKILPMRDGLVEDLQTRDVYSLGMADGTLLSGTGATNENYQGPWDTLWLMDASLTRTNRHIRLSQTLSFGPGDYFGAHGVFAGYGHVIFWDGASSPPAYYKVELETGNVTQIPVGTPPIFYSGCENWAIWGWAENFDGKDYITYVASAGPTYLVRVELTGSLPLSILAELPSSDMCSIIPDPEDGRWYFHYENASSGMPGYPNSGEVLGYCDATYSYGKAL